jgi:hypothetical protein
MPAISKTMEVLSYILISFHNELGFSPLVPFEFLFSQKTYNLLIGLNFKEKELELIVATRAKKDGAEGERS